MDKMWIRWTPHNTFPSALCEDLFEATRANMLPGSVAFAHRVEERAVRGAYKQTKNLLVQVIGKINWRAITPPTS